MSKRPLYGRYLHKEDNPTRETTKKVITGYFEKDSLILPEHYNEEICQLCGISNLKTCRTEWYFGQKFCKACIDDILSPFIDPVTGKRK